MSFRYDFLFIILFALVAVAIVIFPIVPVFKKVERDCFPNVCSGTTYYVTFRTLPQVLKNEKNILTPSYKLFNTTN